jgi:hypothetical protein
MNIDWSKLKTADVLEAEKREQMAQGVRYERDNRMKNVVNWYQRYERETRLGLPHVLELSQIDNYATALATIPEQSGFPEVVNWPEI